METTLARASRTIFVLATSMSLPAVGCSSAESAPVPWCHVKNGLGAVDVGGRLVSCPEISSVEVSPLRLSPGQAATLSGTARDVSSNNLSFSWSAESGTVTDPQASVTTYTCKGGEGIVKLTFVANDGKCEDAVEAVVDCVP